MLDLQTMRLCIALIDEEYTETTQALYHTINAMYRNAEDKPAIAIALSEVMDGILDTIYVLVYTANMCGLDLSPGWEEVQRTNMAKKGGTKASNGKQMKPDDWTPPDLLSIVKEQMA